MVNDSMIKRYIRIVRSYKVHDLIIFIFIIVTMSITYTLHLQERLVIIPHSTRKFIFLSSDHIFRTIINIWICCIIYVIFIHLFGLAYCISVHTLIHRSFVCLDYVVLCAYRHTYTDTQTQTPSERAKQNCEQIRANSWLCTFWYISNSKTYNK